MSALRKPSHRPIPLALLLGLLLIVSLPKFFTIYREMAFNTVPRDDYSRYLLLFVDQPRGQIMPSPAGYRPLAVLPAVPLYWILPPYHFTNLPPVDPVALRATQALAATSYLFILATSMLAFFTARRYFHTSTLTGLVTALLAYLLLDSTAIYGIDPISIFCVALLVYLLDKPAPFAIMVLVSTAVNEKIPILFIALLTTRTLLTHTTVPHRLQLLASAMALSLYGLARLILPLPGAEHQTNPAAFPASFATVLSDTLSLKGTILNILPALAVLLLWLLAMRLPKSPSRLLSISIADLVPFLVLLVLSFLARVEFNVGRISLYAFPLYLPAAASYLGILYSPPDRPPSGATPTPT